MHGSVLRTCAVLVVIVLFLVLLGCGGGSSRQHASPVFASTPSMAASEGSAYSYVLSASDPEGGAVSYSLSTAPAGATLSGNTISWTPTVEQARKPNDFSVTVRSSSGGIATQSWSVSPIGTVRVSWVDTYWGESGPVQVPRDFSHSVGAVDALIPQPDGSVVTLQGVGGADGKLLIANVPAGYYWLRVLKRSLFWTPSSEIDLGSDNNQLPRVVSGSPGSLTQRGTLNVHGLEPSPGGRLEIRVDDVTGISIVPIYLMDDSVPLFLPSDYDLTSLKSLTALEYKGTQFGSHKGYALGPAGLITDLSLTNEGPNNIDIQLQSGELKSVVLNIKGSAWEPLFTRVAPGSVTWMGTPFEMGVEPYIGSPGTGLSSLAGRTVRLFGPELSVTDNSGVDLTVGFTGTIGGIYGCQSFPGSFVITSPKIDSDEGLGTVEYRDPFPVEWTRYFTLCQEAIQDITLSDGTTQKVRLTNSVSTALPNSPVVPLIGPVRNPTINDADLFTAGTLHGPSYTLKWTVPELGQASAYRVTIWTEVSRSGKVGLFPGADLWTKKTSMTLPPELVESGKPYLIQITAIYDSRADSESSPRRTGIPSGNADVVSAPITIN